MDFTKHELCVRDFLLILILFYLNGDSTFILMLLKLQESLLKQIGLLGVKFLCYLYDKWVFHISHEDGVLLDSLYSPHYIIVSEDGVARFSTTEESVEICKLTNNIS